MLCTCSHRSFHRLQLCAMHRMAVNEALCKHFPNDMSVSTRNAYISQLKNLWKNGLRRDVKDLAICKQSPGKWTLEHSNELVKYIMNKPFKPNTRKNYINAMMTLMPDGVERRLLGVLMDELREEISEMEALQGQDEREKLKGMSHVDLVKVVDEYKERLQRHSAVKESRPMTEAELSVGGYDLIFSYLALVLMVLHPPLRGDYGDMKMQYAHPSIKDNQYDWDQNTMLLYESSKSATVLIYKDKVSKNMGMGTIVLAPHIASVVHQSWELLPRTYLFCSRTNTDKPLGDFCKFLRGLRTADGSRCLNQGVQLLRSSYITYFYSDPYATLADKRELARKMRHSQAAAENFYRKIL